MPKGKPKHLPVPVEDEEEEEQVEVSEGMMNLMETLQDLGDRAESVMLTRWDPEKKKKQYVATIPVPQFTFDYVRDTHGGGDFTASTTDKRGKVVNNQAFSIEGPKKELGVVPAAATPTPTPTGGGASLVESRLTGELAGLKTVVDSQTTMVNNLLAAMIGKAAKGSDKDPLEVGMQIAALIKGDGGGSSKEFVKDLADSMRDGFKLGMEVANPDDSFKDVIAALAPPVTRVLEAYLPGPGGTPPAVPPPVQRPQLVKPEVPAMDFSKAPWLVHLRPFMGEIQGWAKAGWDPAAYVGSMVARIPDNILDEIEAAAQSDPQFVEHALEALPAPFQAYKGWLTKALEELKAEVTAPEDKADEEEDEPGAAPGQ
jgi:hypothetical protein